MNRFIALLQNEWTKILRKKILYLILILIIFAIVGLAALFPLTGNIYYEEEVDFSEVKAEMITELEYVQSERSQTEKQIAVLTNGEDIPSDYNYLMNLNDLLENTKNYERTLQIALENRINIFNSDFKLDLISELATLQMAKSQETDVSATEVDETISNLYKILEQNDYNKYIEYQIEMVKRDQNLSQPEIDIRVSDFLLELKINPEGKSFYPGKYHYINLQSIRDYNYEILTQGHSYYTPMTANDSAQALQKFQIANYYLSRPIDNLPKLDTSGNLFPGLAVTFGAYGMIFLIIILAGSIISQEISTGSIKGLIIAPVKRYKIFDAKLLNIIGVSFVGMIIVYLVTLLSSLIFIDEFYRLPYAFTIGNEIQVMPFSLYLLLLCLVKTSSVIMAGLLALMLSTTTRSTSIAVGTAMIFHVGIFSIYSFVKIISYELYPIVSFLPFEYLDLSKYILPPISGITSDIGSILGYNHNGFVLQIPQIIPYLYWLVMAICLIWIARDSFVKRDL